MGLAPAGIPPQSAESAAMLQMAHFSLRCVISPKTSPGRAVPPFWRRIRFITARGKAVPIWRFCVNPRIEEQAQMLITESTVSPSFSSGVGG